MSCVLDPWFDPAPSAEGNKYCNTFHIYLKWKDSELKANFSTDYLFKALKYICIFEIVPANFCQFCMKSSKGCICGPHNSFQERLHVLSIMGVSPQEFWMVFVYPAKLCSNSVWLPASGHTLGVSFQRQENWKVHEQIIRIFSQYIGHSQLISTSLVSVCSSKCCLGSQE